MRGDFCGACFDEISILLYIKITIEADIMQELILPITSLLKGNNQDLPRQRWRPDEEELP